MFNCHLKGKQMDWEEGNHIKKSPCCPSPVILCMLKDQCFLSISRCSLLLFPTLLTGNFAAVCLSCPTAALFLWACYGGLISIGSTISIGVKWQSRVSPWSPWVLKYVLNLGLEWTKGMQKHRYASSPVSVTLQHESGLWLSCCSYRDKVWKTKKEKDHNYCWRVHITRSSYCCKRN